MKFYNTQKVVIRIAGEHLQYGDIAIIKEIGDGEYLCFCPLRNIGEWFGERQIDKVKEVEKTKSTSIVRRKEQVVVPDKPQRESGVYNNIPVYDYGKE